MTLRNCVKSAACVLLLVLASPLVASAEAPVVERSASIGVSAEVIRPFGIIPLEDLLTDSVAIALVAGNPIATDTPPGGTGLLSRTLVLQRPGRSGVLFHLDVDGGIEHDFISLDRLLVSGPSDLFSRGPETAVLIPLEAIVGSLPPGSDSCVVTIIYTEN